MSEPFKFPPGWDPFGISQHMGALGAASTEMLTAWSKTWQTVLQERGEPAARAMLDPAAWSADGDYDPEAVLERWLGMPRFADLFMIDAETLKSGAHAVQLAQVASAYTQAAVLVWSEVCQRFQEQVAAPDSAVEGPGDALDLWNAAVDETLMRFNRSETFADLQRRFIRAAMGFRLEQRKMLERACELYDLPTRSEVDALGKRLHDLERENRALRRRLEAGPPSRRSKG